MLKKKFIVVGSGISGLSNAFHLFKRYPQCSIQIFEEHHEQGGAIRTSTAQGFLCEEGPRSIRNSKYCFELFKMIDAIGLHEHIEPAKLLPYVFIYHDGKLRRIPQAMELVPLMKFYMDHPNIITNLVKFLGATWMANNQFNGMKYQKEVLQHDVSIEEYYATIGHCDHIKNKFIETIFYGIYGTQLSNISSQLGLFKKHVDTVFYKDMQSFDDSRNSTTYSSEFQQSYKLKEVEKCKSFRFTHGVQQLTQTINEYLMKQMGSNYNIKYNTTITQLQNNQQVVVDGNTYEYDHLFLNVPVTSLQKIFMNSFTGEGEDSTSIRKILNQIETTGLRSQNVCFEGKIIPERYNGVGYLINPKQNQNLLGVLFDSSSYPQLTPNGNTQISFLSQKDKTTSIDDNIKELTRHLGIGNLKPLATFETNWYDTLPVYKAGHYDRSLTLLKNIHKLSGGQIHIGGNCLFTPAIPELVLQSKWLVDGI